MTGYEAEFPSVSSSLHPARLLSLPFTTPNSCLLSLLPLFLHVDLLFPRIPLLWAATKENLDEKMGAKEEMRFFSVSVLFTSHFKSFI